MTLEVKTAEWLEWVNPMGQRERVGSLPDGVGFAVVGAWARHDGKAYEFTVETPRDAHDFWARLELARAARDAAVVALRKELA